MYTDFIGLNIPAVLILNLMDVAENKGIHIDVQKLSARLGIPVIGFVASDQKRYGELKKTLSDAIAVGKIADQSRLIEYYRNDTALSFDELVSKQPEKKIYTKEKSAMRSLEKSNQGLMASGKHKYAYINEILKGVVKRPAANVSLNSFDKIALGRHSGKWIALGIIAASLMLAMLVAAPIMALGFIMAIVFNVPCTMTVAATFRENHSKKWIALSVLYYLVFSLILAFVFYHIGLMIWH